MGHIVVCDIGGIQKYLFDIKKNKSATKRLKGRSYFVELLLDKVTNEISAQFDGEVFIQNGGKSIVVCKSFDFEKFLNYKSSLESDLFKQFYGDLRVYFGIGDYQSAFSNSLQLAFDDLEKNKKSAFDTILQKDGQWVESSFIFEGDRGEDSVCDFTRGDLIDKKTFESEYIKGILKEDTLNKKGVSANVYNDLIISKFISSGKKSADGLLGKFAEKIELKNVEDLIFLQKGIPVTEDGSIKTFEELAGKDNFNKLACLKGDIDDLGQIFTFAIKKDNYQANYKRLSEVLDSFWNKDFYELIDKNSKYKNHLYVVYAGGDDFLLLGGRNDVILFYKDLLSEFKSKISTNKDIKDLLVEDQDLHFSAAINLFGAHDTFFTVVKQTEELLSLAKQKDTQKNKINIFGQVIDNDDYEKILKEAEAFDLEFLQKDANGKSVVSTGTLRFMLDIANKILLEKAYKNDSKLKQAINQMEFLMRRAELHYYLSRNYSGKKVSPIKNELKKYFETMLLQNKDQFSSLQGQGIDNFFNKQDIGEKLFVMITLLLYRQRNK